MQWRWPGRGRWQQARSLHEIRELALAAARHVPLVQIRDGPGDPPGWLLALADDPGPGRPADLRPALHDSGTARKRPLAETRLNRRAGPLPADRPKAA